MGISYSVEFCRAAFADAVVQIEWEVFATSMKNDVKQRVELRGGLHDERSQLCVQATGIVKLSVTT